MTRLTTHVLDTAHGKPGRSVEIFLYRIANGNRTLLVSTSTNQEGRCDTPLLEGEAFKAGIYELDFDIGKYFASMGVALPTPSFLNTVTLRFGVADPSQHYHVPLTVSPWSYSTYRGS